MKCVEGSTIAPCSIITGPLLSSKVIVDENDLLSCEFEGLLTNLSICCFKELGDVLSKMVHEGLDSGSTGMVADEE